MRANTLWQFVSTSNGNGVAGPVITDDPDKVEFVQQGGVAQDRIGDIDRIVGQKRDQILRHVVPRTQVIGNAAANRDFNLIDQHAQNVVGDIKLALGQVTTGIEANLRHRGGKATLTVQCAPMREIQEMLKRYRPLIHRLLPYKAPNPSTGNRHSVVLGCGAYIPRGLSNTKKYRLGIPLILKKYFG